MTLPTYFPPRPPERKDSATKSDPNVSKSGPQKKKESSSIVRTSSTFIEGYDNAVVQSNIHYPADAKPVKAPPRSASNTALQRQMTLNAPASERSYHLAAIPDTPQLSPHTERIYQSAITGNAPEIMALANWATIHEVESSQLRQRLRRQQHDFTSLFEMVGAASARALDLMSLQTYMLRTVAGHLATARVMIVRKIQAEEPGYFSVASQGLRNAQLHLGLNSHLCRYAFETGTSFSLADLPDPGKQTPEVASLFQLGLQTAVPLLQEVDHTGAVLEGFIFIGPKLTRKAYGPSEIEFLDILCKMFAICLRNENLYKRSTVDQLTGVSSRGHFDAQLSQQLLRAASTKKRLCLIMLDVDHFKAFNDAHGHQTGDVVLKSMAQLLVEQVRDVDLVARFGGEEFAIVCVEIDRNVAGEVAERLAAAVREMEVVAPNGTKLRVTASFGVACFPDDAKDFATLVQMADEALYHSKNSGRDRVTLADASFRKRGSKIRKMNSNSSIAIIPLTPELARRKQEQAARHSASREQDRRK